MEAKNLWGNLKDLKKLKTPLGILREQGALLTDSTGGILEGRVSLNTSYRSARATLDIIAPALDNYSYQILELSYSPEQLYPVRVSSNFLEKSLKPQSEEGFCKALEKILSSPDVRKLVKNLISQCES